MEEEDVEIGEEEGEEEGRDPLAQSFTVDGSGAFLTSFDVYFAQKDETAKLTVQLATVELGIPTINLVQDFTEVVCKILKTLTYQVMHQYLQL